MDKKWKKTLHNNKALQLLSKYLIIVIRELNEKDILGDILKKNLGYDEILIQESSKEILDLNSIKNKKPKRRKKINKEKEEQKEKEEEKEKEKEKENEHLELRKVELIYFCLLKFKGLIRYMNFQGLKHSDIKKISYFIRHISFKRGEYIFRQGDKSDALYGVIKGKVVIRFIKTNDHFRKLNYENIIEEDIQPINNIPVDYFISDCEEESSESDDSENSSNSNSSDVNVNQSKIIQLKKKLSEDSNFSNNKKKDYSNNNNSDNENFFDDSNENNINNDNNLNNEKTFKNDNNLNNEKTFNNDNNLNNENNIYNEKKVKKKIKRKRKFYTFKMNKKYSSSILNSPKSINEKSQKLKDSINEINLISLKTEEQIDNEIDRKIIKERKSKISTKIKYIKKKPKKKITTPKKIIKSYIKPQSPKEEIKDEILFNFIKDFEEENFTITNGMCFGEWGLVYSIPRTTSIYCIEDCDLFYLEKEYFQRILSSKFAQSDSNKINFLTKIFPILKTDMKIGHILTKIVPLFFENESIVYTPFDKAENLYVIYQGECALISLDNPLNKEDYYMRKSNFKIISRLTVGGIAGYESCSKNLSYYNNALLITKEFTTLLKVNIKNMCEKYKDFKETIYPLFEEQKKIYEKIYLRGQKVKNDIKLKRNIFSSDINDNIERIANQVLLSEEKIRNFSNDFKVKKIQLDKNQIMKLKNDTNFWDNNLIDNIKKGRLKNLKYKISKSNLISSQKIPKLRITLSIKDNSKYQKNKKNKINDILKISHSPNLNNIKSKNISSEKSLKKPISLFQENLSTEYNTIYFSKTKRIFEENEFFSGIPNIKRLFNNQNNQSRNVKTNLINYYSNKVFRTNFSPINNKKLDFYNSGKFNLPFLTEV